MTPTLWVDDGDPLCPLFTVIHTTTINISIYQQNIKSVPADDHHNTTQKLFYNTHTTYLYDTITVIIRAGTLSVTPRILDIKPHCLSVALITNLPKSTKS